MNIIKNRIAAVAAGALLLTSVAGMGGAVAGSLITGKDIKNGTVTKADLGKNSVGWGGELNKHTRDKIKSLAGQDGEDGTDGKDGRDGVNGKDGAPGATGPAGPAGPAGAQGPAGPKGEPGEGRRPTGVVEDKPRRRRGQEAAAVDHAADDAED